MKRRPFCTVWEHARDTSDFTLLKQLATEHAGRSSRGDDSVFADPVETATVRPPKRATRPIQLDARPTVPDEAQRP